MTDTIEEIARAMWNSSHLNDWDGPDRQPGFITITPFDRQTYRDHAQAILPILDRRIAEARAAGAAALEGYRAAASYIAADSWDGCSDCMEMLRLARSVDDIPSWTPDETAAAMSRLRVRAGQNPPQSGA